MTFTGQWEPARVEQVKELFEAGVSMLLIAEQLNLTRGKVAGILYRLRHHDGVVFTRSKTLIEKKRQTPRPRVRLIERRPYTPESVGQLYAELVPENGGAVVKSTQLWPLLKDPIVGEIAGEVFLTELPLTYSPEEVSLVVEPAKEAAALSISELTFFDGKPAECRYVVGEGLYCGRKVEGRTSWCLAHQRVVYQPPQQRSVHRAPLFR
jgi:hypothetical protein